MESNLWTPRNSHHVILCRTCRLASNSVRSRSYSSAPRAEEAALVQPPDSGTVCSAIRTSVFLSQAPTLSLFWILVCRPCGFHRWVLPVTVGFSRLSPCIFQAENHSSFGSCKPGFFSKIDSFKKYLLSTAAWAGHHPGAAQLRQGTRPENPCLNRLTLHWGEAEKLQ